MRKRLLCIMLICILLLTAACGKKADDPAVNESQTSAKDPVAAEKSEAAEETEVAPIPTIGGDYELPEGEGVEDWEEPADPKDENIAEEENNTDASDETVESTENKAGDDTQETTPVEEPVKKEGCGCEYAKYLAMSPVEQQEYMGTFSSPMAFIEWCKAAEAEHANHVVIIEASGEVLDIGDYIP